ncbi:hypothetical protein [Pandoraea pnomenusa]|uniref:hypothetical protein n=1 Tax=Pandoraea pnomenusa TaxID=93220 RepID=UPI000A909E86|nr:hypothetical protein [Pandoraea pnomenusa]
MKNPYAAVHRKESITAGKTGALPAPAPTSASAPTAAQPASSSAAPSAPASAASGAGGAGASAAGSDRSADAVFNSDLYHHN